MIDNPSGATPVFRLSNRNPRKKAAMKAAAIAALDAAMENGRPAIEIMMEMTGEPAARCVGPLEFEPRLLRPPVEGAVRRHITSTATTDGTEG